jgi:hypothetical protein
MMFLRRRDQKTTTVESTRRFKLLRHLLGRSLRMMRPQLIAQLAAPFSASAIARIRDPDRLRQDNFMGSCF